MIKCPKCKYENVQTFSDGYSYGEICGKCGWKNETVRPPVRFAGVNAPKHQETIISDPPSKKRTLQVLRDERRRTKSKI